MMVHLVGLRRSSGHMCAVPTLAFALSLLLAAAIEGSHEHTDSDLAGPCAVCMIAHHGTPAPNATALFVVGPGALQAPGLPGHRVAPSVAHRTPRQSRAPPPSISP